MAPPELARDAPVVDVRHPLEVGLGPVLGHEADSAVLDCLDGLRGQRTDAHEPLRRDERLDDRPAPVAVTDGVAMVFDLLERALAFELLDERGARLEPILSRVGPGFRGHPGVFIDHGHLRQVVPLADLEVIRIVGGCHLDRAGAERRIDERIRMGDWKRVPPHPRVVATVTTPWPSRRGYRT